MSPFAVTTLSLELAKLVVNTIRLSHYSEHAIPKVALPLVDLRFDCDPF